MRVWVGGPSQGESTLLYLEVAFAAKTPETDRALVLGRGIRVMDLGVALVVGTVVEAFPADRTLEPGGLTPRC